MPTGTTTQWLVDRDDGLYQYRAWLVPITDAPDEVAVAASLKREMFSIDIQGNAGPNKTRLFKLISTVRSDPLQARDNESIYKTAETLCQHLEANLLGVQDPPFEDREKEAGYRGVQLSLDL